MSGEPDSQELRRIAVMPVWDEPEFDSAHEAIAAVRRSTRSRRAEADTRRFKGLTIVDGRWTDEELQVHLSDGSSLRVYVVGEVVSWELSGPGASSYAPPTDVGPVLLEFTATESAPWTCLWDRAQLVSARVGRPIRLLSSSLAWLWLYCDGRIGLMFSRILTVEDGRSILYWSEVD